MRVLGRLYRRHRSSVNFVGFRFSGLGFEVSRFNTRVYSWAEVRAEVEGAGFRVVGVGFVYRVSKFGAVSVGFRISGFGVRSCECRVSGFGFGIIGGGPPWPCPV